MPVYEYQCTECKREFEYEHRMSDPPRAVCEACGGKLERLISRTSFAFKGGGWYKDLYATPKPEGGGSEKKAETAAPSTDSGTGSGTGTGTGTASGTASGTGSGSGSGGSSGSSTPAAS